MRAGVGDRSPFSRLGFLSWRKTTNKTKQKPKNQNRKNLVALAMYPASRTKMKVKQAASVRWCHLGPSIFISRPAEKCFDWDRAIRSAAVRGIPVHVLFVSYSLESRLCHSCHARRRRVAWTDRGWYLPANYLLTYLLYQITPSVFVTGLN